MSPGTYLKKRRAAAGLSLDALALVVAYQPDRVRPVHRADVAQLTARLGDAEADQINLTVLQAALIRRVIPFDLGVYELLLLRSFGCVVPQPQICRECACTWHDACHTASGPCAWSAEADDLCTACAEAPARKPTTQGEFA